MVTIAPTMPPMRIVSLLPSATEIVFALGLGDALVGVSHMCDYPAAARGPSRRQPEHPQQVAPFQRRD